MRRLSCRVCSMEYPVIMNAIWTTLDQPGKNWRQIYKVRMREWLA